MAQIRLRLGTPTEVRRTLSRILNMVANGEMESKTAITIILGCNAVLSSIRSDEQEKKIEELNRLLEEMMKLYEESRPAAP